MKEYYKVKRVNNSSLSWFQRSPKYFKLMFDKDIDEGTTRFFEKGEQTHQYILEPEEFDKNYIFLDYETPKSPQQKSFCETFARAKKGSKDEKLIKAYKNAYTTKEVDNKILEKANELAKAYSNYIKYIKLSPMYSGVLPNAMRDQLNEARTKILDHIKAKELMFNEEHSTFGNTDKLFIANEFVILWDILGVECKSMLDRIIIDFENKKVTLVDLKTTSHLAEFKEKFDEYKYYRQLAFYWLAIQYYFINTLNLNLDEYVKETYIVAVASNEPTEVKVFAITEPQLAKGLNEIIPLINEIAWHQKENKWEYTRLYYNGQTTEKI